jgi:RHS repeat-associated protein
VDTSTTPKVSYTYDAANGDRLTSEVYPNGRTITYNYNSGLDSTASRISSISDSSGTIQSYTYMGLATPVTFTDGNGIELTYLSTSTGDAGDNVTGLDRFGRVDDQNWINSSSTSVDEFQYGYDADSNVLFKSNTVLTSHSELYGYDGLNRLTSFERGTLNGTKDGITGTPSESESWDLDALGNWNSSTVNGTTTDRTNNAQNQVTELGSATLGYDTNGDTTTDEDGNTLAYDAWNHLVSVKSGSTTIASYTYDAKGQRIIETHGSITTDLYLSTSGQVLEEQQGGVVTAQQAWSLFYVNGLIERDTSSLGDGTLDTRLYIAQDANWNVTSLMDASGNVVERIEYTAYGTATILTASGTVTTDTYGMVYRFQGGRIDPATGLIHFDTRDLNANSGRWEQQDHGGGYVNGLNLYQFVESNPLVHIDPRGLCYLQIFDPPIQPFIPLTYAGGSGEYDAYPLTLSVDNTVGNDDVPLDLMEAAQVDALNRAEADGLAYTDAAGVEHYPGSSDYNPDLAPANQPSLGMELGALSLLVGPEGDAAMELGDLAAEGLDAATEELGVAVEDTETTLFKAPQPGRDPIPELTNGFDAAQYPGDGPYFATDQGVAQDFQRSYQNGMQQFTMPTEDFNNLFNNGVIQPDEYLPPGQSVHVPPEGLDQFNQAIQKGSPNTYAPEEP